MSIKFELDRGTLEDAMSQAAEEFGSRIAREHFGEEHMDWTVSGGESWGGGFTFDFQFRLPDDSYAEFQMQIAGVRNMHLGCPECERSFGPDYNGECDH